MKTFFLWILTVFFSFGAGASMGRDYEPDTELEQKVQAHMDVIVDEAAGIVDDVSEAAEEKRETVESEIKDSEGYKKAEEFVNDVQEIADNTKADIEAHFGSDETETEGDMAQQADVLDETEAETEDDTEEGA